MKYKCSHFLCLFVLLLLYCLSCCANSRSSAGKIQCIAKERDALLQFKNGIELDYGGMLTSWVGQECCLWHRIRCSNNSGHVISFDLSGSSNISNFYIVLIYQLIGTVSPSLVELNQLEYLDLSNNDFHAQPIPSFIGSLRNLKHLDLSYSEFIGEVPHQLANLSSLTYLDLSNLGLNVKDLRWLSHLTLLTNLTLTHANLSLATEWMQTVNNLPLLKSLHMDACSLPIQTSLSLLKYTNSSTTLDTLSLQDNDWKDTKILEWVSNFTQLSSPFSYLNLFYNGFSGPIPSWLGNMHSLLHLDLSFNSFEGPIPETISNLKHLVNFDLSNNKFQGSKWNPEVLGSLCSLQILSLRRNRITNDLSNIIEPLSQCVHKSLVSLDISDNRVWGSLPEEIETFSSLRELHLPYNQLNGTITSSLGQLSMLQTLDLSNNQLIGTISPSLGQLSMVETLDLSSNSLKGIISNHHLSSLSRLTILDLSGNQELVLNVSANWVPPFQLHVIDLGSCKMGPYFPKWLLTQTNFSSLNISNANISDAIPTLFWNSLPSNLGSLDISGNMIHGNIPDAPILFHNSPYIFVVSLK